MIWLIKSYLVNKSIKLSRWNIFVRWYNWRQLHIILMLYSKQYRSTENSSRWMIHYLLISFLELPPPPLEIDFTCAVIEQFAQRASNNVRSENWTQSSLLFYHWPKNYGGIFLQSHADNYLENIKMNLKNVFLPS